MKILLFSLLLFFLPDVIQAQLKWTNVDSLFGDLPASVHVYRTTDSLDGKPNIAYYVRAHLQDKGISFTADTTYQRRLTPAEFYKKNGEPLIVVNCSFFSFATNQNLNVVIKDGKMVSYNPSSIAGKGKDTLQYFYPFRSAIGIDKDRNADVAWLYTDSTRKWPIAFESPLIKVMKGNKPKLRLTYKKAKAINRDHGKYTSGLFARDVKNKWEMETAVGGGPVLIDHGMIHISNETEMMFTGKAIADKHPRTAMGFSNRDSSLIILVVQGRFPGIAEGATLQHMAKILYDIGCFEALNLDGGGSSCLLVNGKNTIQPSDKGEQRPVPAVFIIRNKSF
jgi:exopolysaccharide biosynthesis protein